MKARKHLIIPLLCALSAASFFITSCRDAPAGPSSLSPQEESLAANSDTAGSAEEQAMGENGEAPGEDYPEVVGSNPVSPTLPDDALDGSFTGTILEAGMGKFLVEVDGSNGMTLSVDFTQADTSTLVDSRPGARITVTYDGTIEGRDLSGITVHTITQAE